LLAQGPSNLSSRQRERIQDLKGSNLQAAEAYRVKLNLQDFHQQPNVSAAGRFLEEWCDLVAWGCV